MLAVTGLHARREWCCPAAAGKCGHTPCVQSLERSRVGDGAVQRQLESVGMRRVCRALNVRASGMVLSSGSWKVWACALCAEPCTCARREWCCPAAAAKCGHAPCVQSLERARVGDGAVQGQLQSVGTCLGF
eukprot:26640-Chlamydomonas_euryale.AAC.2